MGRIACFAILTGRDPYGIEDPNSTIGHKLVTKLVSAMHMVSAAPSAVQNDREVVLAAVAKSAAVLQYAAAELRTDRKFVLAAVAQNGHALEHVSVTLQNDKGVVLAAVAQNGSSLWHDSVVLKSDREVVLKAKGLDNTNREAVLAVVAKSGGAQLQYAAAELRNDKTFVLAAMAVGGDTRRPGPRGERAAERRGSGAGCRRRGGVETPRREIRCTGR